MSDLKDTGGGPRTAIAEFLHLLWPSDVPEDAAMPCVAIVPNRGPSGVEFAPDVASAAAWLAARDAEGCDVYVQAAAMTRSRARSLADAPGMQRGSASDVAIVAGFYVDLDVGDGKFCSIDDAVAFARSGALPIAPTALVGTGGGVHAWLLFTEPVEVDGEDDLRRLEAGVHGYSLAARVAAHERAGARLDAVWDLARIGRVPGTTNRKITGKPRRTSLLSADGPRINPSDLETYAVEPTRATAGQSAVVERLGGFTIDPTADVGLGKFNALCENDERFKRSWEHRRSDLADQSNSGYDQALTNAAAMAGWTLQETCDLMAAHRRKWAHCAESHKRDPLKLRNPGYWVATLARAFDAAEKFRAGEVAAAREERRTEELKEIADAPSGALESDEFAREKSRRTIRDYFREKARIDLDRVERFGDASGWSFRAILAGDDDRGGMIVFRTDKQLHAWSEWYHALLVRGLDVSAKPPKGWSQALAAMHRVLVVRNEDTGQEEGLVGFLAARWAAAADAQRADGGDPESGGRVVESVVKRRGAALENWGWFREGAAIDVHIDRFLDHYFDVSVVRPYRERKHLAAALKSAGARRVTVAVPRSTVSVYRLTVDRAEYTDAAASTVAKNGEK